MIFQEVQALQKRCIDNDFLLKAGPYSHIVEAGGFLFLTGIDPMDLEKGLIITDDIVKATEIVLENMKRSLESVGSSLAKVVKVTVFLRDMGDFVKLNEVYARYFPVDPPARTCVAVKEVPGNFQLKVEAIAIK
jgi:2-iminobutanoate/2-iminopropanoate deaminase